MADSLRGSNWLTTTQSSQAHWAQWLPVTINLPTMRLPATTANMTTAHIISRMQRRKKFLTKR